jgi:hypothetical protein
MSGSAVAEIVFKVASAIALTSTAASSHHEHQDEHAD